MIIQDQTKHSRT